MSNIIFVYILQPLYEYLHDRDIYISYYSQNGAMYACKININYLDFL